MKNNHSTGHRASQLPVRFPWWVSVLLAIVGYCTFKLIIPNFSSENNTLQKFIQAAPTFAPIITVPFLLLAAKQLYDTDIKKEESEQPGGDEKEGSQE